VLLYKYRKKLVAVCSWYRKVWIVQIEYLYTQTVSEIKCQVMSSDC